MSSILGRIIQLEARIIQLEARIIQLEAWITEMVNEISLVNLINFFELKKKKKMPMC